MLREYFLTIPFKALALIGTILFARELLEFPEIYIEVIYIIGWINLLKIFDFSIPYLGRVNFALNKKLDKQDIFYYIIIASFFNYFVLDLLSDFENFEILIIIICSRLFSFFNYELNISQKSYLINFPFSLSILSIIILRFYSIPITDLIFLQIYFLYTTILFIFSIYDYKKINDQLVTHSFTTLINSNYFFNLITMSLWAISSELYAIYALEVLTTESYTKINQYIRISLIFISIAAVISNINWNEYHNKISLIDDVILKPIYSFFVLPFIFIFIYFFARDFQIIEIFILSLYSIFSMQTLYLSQLSARLSMSKLLLISAFFELSILFIGLNLIDNHLLLLINSLFIQIVKYFFLRHFAYMKLKGR